MLAHPPDLLERERGDRRAGFYRRWYPGGTSPDSDAGRLEAYSWGGLTSGPASRALWLLFLPFVLVDLAHWMLPPLAEGRPDRSARLASTHAAAARPEPDLHLPHRDLGGDARPRRLAVRTRARGARIGSRRSGGSAAWTPGPRLAVAALVPAAIVAILWRLGRQDLRPHSEPPPGAAVQAARAPARRTRGSGTATSSELRLRAVHIAAWSSALGALVLAPTLQAASNDVGTSVIAVLLVLHLSVLGACIGVTCSERVTGRGGDGRARGRPARCSGSAGGRSSCSATGLVAAAVVPADWDDHPDVRPDRPAVPAGGRPSRLLRPGPASSSCSWPRRPRPAALAAREGRAGFAVALRGLAAPATAFSAWLVAVTFGVGHRPRRREVPRGRGELRRHRGQGRGRRPEPCSSTRPPTWARSSPPSSARRRSSCRPATSGRARRSS